ncbi:GNAT family N-acetyltransferase [Brevundimonas viscosa]|uniref:N-acetylglutamate synthase, GNAT family n=1 Tax=Brevundimonas viscosa TaxID=871741 RepID=A0A1I6Q2C3_9CAUL|nr:GNAT family N-acetyltransferase [Brevundimonas viscosa]SFS46562.1 N-acetylglutamate synthase, GNAT family [Brevundimonas viscosa]
MTEPTFRRATADDVPALHGLVHGAYRGESARRGWTHEADLLDGNRIDLPTLKAIVADPTQAVLLAERDGRLLGCVQVTDKGRGLAYLGMLTVAPALQGEGLGRSLISAAEAEARGRFGAGKMEMTVIVQRTELIDWYVRRGYRPTGETRPFPAADPRFGTPRRNDLAFMVLERALA